MVKCKYWGILFLNSLRVNIDKVGVEKRRDFGVV